MELKVYPLDGDKSLMHVCYSKDQFMRYGEAITHIVHKDGKRTLCGINLNKNRYVRVLAGWQFYIWNVDQHHNANNVGCLRCRKSRLLVDGQ